MCALCAAIAGAGCSEPAATQNRRGGPAAYSMLLTRGVFRRGGAPRANAEWELIAFEDPHGFASLTRLVQWRRAMPTINFALGSATVNWAGHVNPRRAQIARGQELFNTRT